MVKADVRRDYYADLGLTPSADAEDIKKQFRKLALKYHPDRNPGKEVEFIAKFQAIQAANEILSDNQQRLRYDTDRLRAGYGKYYGPPKTSPRKAQTNHHTPPSAKPHTKQSFSSRPQSFNGGPSSGAQRYASYARAAPKQPWEKAQDEGQTRADAYRGFQDMKGNQGWSQFDPRTGRSGHASSTPRANTSSQSARPKSAYEYFKTSPKPNPDSARAQSTKKKQGFAPRAAAGGDEPMATNTSSYSNVPRGERPHMKDFFGPAPSPTARKAAAGFQTREDDLKPPDVERTGSKYAGTGGERTFFSSAGLHRFASMRESTGTPKPHSRTNPPTPTPPEPGRHRSASPQFKTDSSRNYTSTSSSDTEDDEFRTKQKPKAVPKSRLRPHQRYGDFHTQHRPEFGTGHASNATASAPNIFGATRPKNLFEPQSFQFQDFPTDGASKSSSHDDLRKPFSADEWQNVFDFFTPSSSDKDQPQSKQGWNFRGRTANRTGTGRASHSASISNPDSSRSGSTFPQQPPTFSSGFAPDNWAGKLDDLFWSMPRDDGYRQPPAASSQRPKSPRKPVFRSPTKARAAPQPASVATEDEEAKLTVNGYNKQDPARTGDAGGEAMDIDDETPTKNSTAPPEKAMPGPGKEAPPVGKPVPTGDERRGDKTKSKSQFFDLKNLGNTAPFTSTTNGGIEDLQDIHANLPFESRSKVPRTTIHDIRPRKLACPNPPKRPQPPQLVAYNHVAHKLALPRKAWERYVEEMNTYMREWGTFNRLMLRHFNARQEAVETGMASNWIGAVGDSARLHIDDDEGNQKKPGGDGDSDDDMVPGSGKGGYSAYLRGLDEDVKVMKHWEVARELHRECILKLGEMREWILSGGKVI
ncbi:DnaJ domain protein [Aspergillus avenaceus]|uniref:DnaJ domain protein n=1 Tax=Aspergillus avenaceus TaxID=36643 RepID=A0A5N6TED4_ASPAV|nr:DnaJ domain protein [Aspergillus avenaceus]